MSSEQPFEGNSQNVEIPEILLGINIRELEINGVHSQVFNNIVKYNTASKDMFGSFLQSLQMDVNLMEAFVNNKEDWQKPADLIELEDKIANISEDECF